MPDLTPPPPSALTKTDAPVAAMRARVDRLAAETLALALPQAYCHIRHYFAPFIFAREISISKGTTVIGALHKTENLVCVSLGRLLVETPQGCQEVCAGETFTCLPGMQNAVHALENARWTNFFANPDNETDIDTLIERLVEAKASELLGGKDNIQLAALALAQIKED